jgi:prefoldin subunit 5
MDRNITNLREAVAVLDEIQLDIETAKEALENNFENYKKVSDISNENIDKFQSVLQGINSLQIKVVEALEKGENLSGIADSIIDKQRSDNKALYGAIKKEIEAIEAKAGEAVNNAVNNIYIDTKELSKIIDQKIGTVDLSRLSDLVTRTNAGFDKSIAMMAHSMNQVKKIDNILRSSIKGLNDTADKIDIKVNEINDAANNINSINRSVSMAMSLALLAGGAVIGFGIATYFKIDAVSDHYFSKYDKELATHAQTNIDLKNRVETLEHLPKFLKDNDIFIGYGIYNDTDTPFIRLKQNQMSKESDLTFVRDGEQFIGFD